ncbi:MAG TPA: tripartite tricarboxylate transporter substrate binding protein [Burkholderiales bacterium]|nr:tripartite tricarboxylate transporter substrate binding protein [Burkholderiales bacterium]
MKYSIIGTLVAAACAAASAHAQQYPTKPVRIVVPTNPGGGADIQARLVAKAFQESIGGMFIVENRSGASGTIGADIVAKAPADGYTVLVTTSLLATSATLYRKLPYDALKDLTPVSQISSAPQYLVVHPTVPARTVKEFVALAKSQPGKLNAGSSGSGSANHLAVEMLKQRTGIDVHHIPYKSGAPAMTALIGGEVDFTFTGAVTALPPIRARQVRALGVTSLKASSATPDVPPLAATYPGFESANWYALFVPAGTPALIVSKLSAETAKAIKSPAVRDFIRQDGADPVGSSPQEFAAFFKREIARYAEVIRKGKVQVD